MSSFDPPQPPTPPPPAGPAAAAPPPAPPTPPAYAPPRPAGSGGGSGKKVGLIAGAVVAVIAIIGAIVAVAAGGGGDDDDPDTTVAASDTTIDRSDGGPSSGPAVASLEDVQTATIQITTDGSFRDPEFGFVSGAGAGSGFIIDPSGIAVTNNHVVTGAASMKVYVGGNDDKPLNARILGVSECSDLAVIDIEGEGFPYLQWYDGDIRPGLEVYAAGFPLGDPNYTLTNGIVSKAETQDFSPTSNIERVIEHDANIQPGNSGGPLVTKDGRVVAVNYAGADFAGTGTEQFFAIPAAQARPLVDQMAGGKDVDSLGINGTAVVDEEGTMTGVWVSGVAAGTPAGNVGLKPGDIITRLAGTTVAEDGTLKDYCDILRTQGAESPIAVEVVRFDTAEVYEGEFNGRELELSFSFAEEFEEDVPDATGSYTSYETVTDDNNLITVQVPAEWNDRSTSPGTVMDVPSSMIIAAPSVDGFVNGFEVPGMQFSYAPTLGAADVTRSLDSLSFANSCTSGGRDDYSDPVFVGQYDVWTDCGNAGSTLIVLSAARVDGQQGLALVFVQIVTDADLEALDRVLDTFNTL